jgi:hypothetical protein
MNILIKLPKNKTVTIDVDPHDTIWSVLHKINMHEESKIDYLAFLSQSYSKFRSIRNELSVYENKIKENELLEGYSYQKI